MRLKPSDANESQRSGSLRGDGESAGSLAGSLAVSRASPLCLEVASLCTLRPPDCSESMSLCTVCSNNSVNSQTTDDHANNASLNLDENEHLPRHPPSTDEHC